MTPTPLHYLLGALAGLLLVAGAIIWQRGARIETLEARVKAEQAAHAVTRQSVATLQAALAEKNAESDARAASYAATKAADAEDVAAAARARAADSGRVETLRAIAKAADRPGGCVTPPALAASLEGL